MQQHCAGKPRASPRKTFQELVRKLKSRHGREKVRTKLLNNEHLPHHQPQGQSARIQLKIPNQIVLPVPCLAAMKRAYGSVFFFNYQPPLSRFALGVLQTTTISGQNTTATSSARPVEFGAPAKTCIKSRGRTCFVSNLSDATVDARRQRRSTRGQNGSERIFFNLHFSSLHHHDLHIFTAVRQRSVRSLHCCK